MISPESFVDHVVRVAKQHGYRIESHARTGEIQIDFGNKKLHAGHLRAMLPGILAKTSQISALIDNVAPGRPCAHRPMREIIEALQLEGHL